MSGDRRSVKRAGKAKGKGLRDGAMRMGDLLVHMGVMTEDQRDQVLEAQKQSPKPFGVLAEKMFGVSPSDVERAWARQFAQLAATIDPRALEVPAEVSAAINRRQAWQFRVLPLELRGTELVVATTEECLPRAMRFMGWRVDRPVSFVLAEPEQLGEALCTHHPMGGMRASDVRLAPCST